MTTATMEGSSPCLLRLRESRTGRAVGCVPLGPELLRPAMAELWRDGFLRAGAPGSALADLTFRLWPPPPDAATPGIARLGVSGGAGDEWCARDFPVAAFRMAALALCAQQVAAGTLASDADVHFTLEAGTATPHTWREEARLPLLGVAAAGLRAYPLSRLWPAGNPPPDAAAAPDFPVLFTRRAWEDAERYSRAGWDATPPVESGCMLLGHVCASADPVEAYVVVTQALPVQAAEADRFSLRLSGESWNRIERFLAARAAQGLRAVGQAHGHNFYPAGDGQHCPVCPKQATCPLHSAFLSDDDARWMAAVFPPQRHPFQLAMVFGIDPTGGGRHRLFSLREGHLQARPYTLIEALPPDFLTRPPSNRSAP